VLSPYYTCEFLLPIESEPTDEKTFVASNLAVHIGVNLINVEWFAFVDVSWMGRCVDSIFRIPDTCHHKHERCKLDNYRLDTFLELVAEEALDSEIANLYGSRIQHLVLERAFDMANSASKLVVCCYSKLGRNCPCPLKC